MTAEEERGAATSYCPECGAFVVDGICPKCGASVGLETYGYRVKRAQNKGYILTQSDDSPLLTFGALGSRTVADLVNRTGAPKEVVERALAALANAEPHIEEEDEAEVLVRYAPALRTAGFLAEQVWDGRSVPRYVVRHFDEDSFEHENEISLGESDDKGREIIYRPVYNDHLVKGLATVPVEPVECTFEEVIHEAFIFVGNLDFYDPCGKLDQVKLSALIAIGSWFLDRMEPKTKIPIAGVGRFAPIIPIRGPSETGKNRLANLLRFLSYHPYFDLSKTAVPSLFRPMDLWKGTLIMDEADFWRTGTTSELIHFLNARATGTPISRVNPDNVKDLQAFDSFGLTIVTQRQHFDDNATESRCLPYYSEKTMRKLPTVELDEVAEQGLILQNKLLYLRLRYWPEIVIDKRYWIEGLSDHRLNAALLPVIAISRFDPQIEQIIKETTGKVEAVKRRIKANSLDGQVVNLLWEKLEQGLYGTSNQMHYVLDQVITTEAEDGRTEETPEALIVSRVKERLGLSFKVIRKTLDSLNVAPEDAPARAHVGKRRVRPIWFRPYQMEKQLREFVVDYEDWSLYEKMGLEEPKNGGVMEVMDKNGTEGTDGTVQGVRGGPDSTISSYSKKTPLTHIDLSHPSYPSQKGLVDARHEAEKPSEHGKQDTVIDLSRDKQAAIVNDAAEFLSKMDGHKADHEFYLSFLMRKHPDVSKAALTVLLWNHPDFRRTTSWSLTYIGKGAEAPRHDPAEDETGGTHE